MTKLDAKNMPAKELCARIRESTDTALAVEHVNGQRYIAAGLGKKELTLTGTPGNALGAYLNGTRITVLGNAQDATGDTMNDGAIFVHGSSGLLSEQIRIIYYLKSIYPSFLLFISMS